MVVLQERHSLYLLLVSLVIHFVAYEVHSISWLDVFQKITMWIFIYYSYSAHPSINMARKKKVSISKNEMHLGAIIRFFGNLSHGGKIPCSKAPSNYTQKSP